MNFKNVSLITDGEDGVTDGDDGDGDDEEVAAPLEKLSPELSLQSKAAVLDYNSTEALSDISPTALLTVDETKLSNATATESDLSDKNDPKR